MLDKIKSHGTDVFFWRRVFVAVLVLCLIPLAWIGLYAHAAGDDFAYSAQPHLAWEATHSLLSFFSSCAEKFIWHYTEWHGCYSSILLGVLDPVAFGDSWYVLTPFLLIGSLVASNFCFWRVLAAHSYKGQCGADDAETVRTRRAIADIAACVLCLTEIELIPRAYDMFYWWDGAMNYLPYYCLILLVLALLIKLFDERRLGAGFLILTCVLTFFGVGGNYTTALSNVLIILCMGVLLFYLYAGRVERKVLRRLSLSWFLVAATSIAGLLVSALGPGNAMRMEEESAGGIQSIPKAIIKSIALAGESVTDTLSVMMVLLLLLPLPFLWMLAKDAKRQDGAQEDTIPRSVLRLPSVLVLGGLFLLYAASFSPTVYVYGTEGPMRAVDGRFFYCVFYLFLAELFLVGKARMMLAEAGVRGMMPGRNRSESPSEQTVPGTEEGPALAKTWNQLVARYVTAGIALILLYAGLYYVLPRENREVLPTVCAVRSLLIGEAQEFDRQMDERARLLEDDATDGEDVLLPALTERPYLLFLYGLEITDDSTHWINESVAEYYNKASVALYPEEEETGE